MVSKQNGKTKEQVIKMSEKLAIRMPWHEIFFLKELQHSLEISNHSLALFLATRATDRIRNQSDLQGRKN